MTETAPIRVLISEFDKGRAVLDRIEAFYARLLEEDQPLIRRSTRDAIVLAEIIVSYYTCAETLFFRISQHFENTLAPGKWHRDLLEKMSLEIDGVREHVIGEATKTCLDELLRFRHFKRYYFEFGDDWLRLEYLLKQFEAVRPLLRADLDRFLVFLLNLAKDPA